MPITVAVYTSELALTKKAQELATKMNLPYVMDQETTYDYFLILTSHGLGLQKKQDQATPLVFDFLSKPMLYRSQHATVKREMLARALGLKSTVPCTILDTTAGLGRDSFILAALGFEVILLERSPIIHALLEDALQRAAKHPRAEKIIARMRLIHTDACEFLSHHPNAAPIIYLDPMFPARTKSALVKKEMRYLQDMTENALYNDDVLLNHALRCDAKRVVVKRPRLAPTLTSQPASFSLLGTSNRFDIYLKDHRGNSASAN